MYQLISSSIVAAPPPSYVLKMLHNNKALYVPQNGHRSTHAVSDTKEDMMEIFQTETNGTAREMKKLMGRRNYAAFVAFDPEVVAGQSAMGAGGFSSAATIVGGMAGGMGGSGYAGSVYSGSGSGSGRGSGLNKLSLAVDFIVQGEGAYGAATKYGPVIVPSLEFGR